MTVQYIHLDYEAYKALEEQMHAFAETTHKSTGGFYHKSIRLRIGADLVMEFHGPLVGGYGHQQDCPHVWESEGVGEPMSCPLCGARKP